MAMRPYRFWTYILTNWTKTVLYTGVTNDLSARLVEHWIGKDGCFTTRYHVHYLLWFDETQYVKNAIQREKEIKNSSRNIKERLIGADNPDWCFWNERILGNWPPTDAQITAVKARWRKEEEEGTADALSFLQRMGTRGLSR